MKNDIVYEVLVNGVEFKDNAGVFATRKEAKAFIKAQALNDGDQVTVLKHVTAVRTLNRYVFDSKAKNGIVELAIEEAATEGSTNVA